MGKTLKMLPATRISTSQRHLTHELPHNWNCQCRNMYTHML
jgi:hypothetical protein